MVVFAGKNFIKALVAILIDGESGDILQRDNRFGILCVHVFTSACPVPGFVNYSVFGHHSPDDNTLIK